MNKKFIKTLATASIVGGLGLFLSVGLSGCADKSSSKEDF